MDKATFEKEIFTQVEPNYALGLFNQVALDRSATITSMASLHRAIASKVDFLYLYSFASIVRSGVSSAIRDNLDVLSPDLVRTSSNWFDRAQVLMTAVQNAKNAAGNVGIFKDTLAYLARR
jgi:hypothetical protein